MYAETCEQAREAVKRFAADYGAKYPKAVVSLAKDADTLLTFFDFPAEHWKHLRTSNVIESPFATVRLRQRVTKGAGSRTKGLLMAYKLLDMAQARWRRLNGAHLLPLVRAGIGFVDGRSWRAKSTQGESESGVITPLRPRSRTSRSTIVYRSSSSRALASCSSLVSKPSVNQAWTGARRARA